MTKDVKILLIIALNPTPTLFEIHAVTCSNLPTFHISKASTIQGRPAGHRHPATRAKLGCGALRARESGRLMQLTLRSSARSNAMRDHSVVNDETAALLFNLFPLSRIRISAYQTAISDTEVTPRFVNNMIA
jgi:hypothetical protein